jgi:transposase
MIRGLFGNIVGDSPQYRWLPHEELLEVLMSKDVARSEVFIAAASDPVTKTVSLLRGDRRAVVVPFSNIKRSGDGIDPDFTNIAVTDYGRTVSFGGYEAASDAILYEVDPEYRKKLLKKRKEAERSFGASLLRLRKQKKLKRDAFAPLAAKTIARLERNEIGKPHGKTLQAIAARLGVEPEEIETY